MERTKTITVVLAGTSARDARRLARAVRAVMDATDAGDPAGTYVQVEGFHMNRRDGWTTSDAHIVVVGDDPPP